MKIKTKLIISFCIMLFVPITLAGITITGFLNIQARNIEQTYGIKDADIYYLSSSVQMLDHMTKKEYEDIRRVALDNPDNMDNESYLRNLNSQLQNKYSYIVVKKSNITIFNGGEDNSKLVEDLLTYDEFSKETSAGGYFDATKKALIKQINFMFPDADKGAIYIVTTAQDVIPEVKTLLVDSIFAVFVILFLTAVMMVVWIYSSMINPIKKLQIAAENIKEGNLDYELNVYGDDEIGELCVSFEQMRLRLKENAQEKINNEKENRALISNKAHDLKTPITAVKGYSEGILDGVANTPEKLDKYIRTIYSKASEMDTLINELTLYSKIDTNRIPYNFAKINVADYFMDCIEEIGLDLESRGIGLAYHNYVLDDTIIIADPEQLRRVVSNIVGNSIKYMNKQNGLINIRINDVGDFIQVEIEDNGRGIAQKDLPYIFDRFYRADASRNSATGGSGIGLSIVKKIIEDHGGKIWATSKEGTGTTMFFVIRKHIEEVPSDVIDIEDIEYRENKTKKTRRNPEAKPKKQEL